MSPPRSYGTATVPAWRRSTPNLTAVDRWQVFDNNDAETAALLVAEGESGGWGDRPQSEAWTLVRSSIAVAQADVAITQDPPPGAESWPLTAG
jgi:hypothetical protein